MAFRGSLSTGGSEGVERGDGKVAFEKKGGGGKGKSDSSSKSQAFPKEKRVIAG